MKTTTRMMALLLAVLMIVSMLSGCATKPYVMVIDDYKVRQGVYAYYYGYNYYSYYENYGDSAVQYYTITSLFQHAAIYKLFEEYGLELTEEDEAKVEQLRTARIDSLGGQGGYAAFLKTLGLTDKLYREILTISPMYEKLKNHLYGEGGELYVSEEEVRQIYADAYAHEVHIYISTLDVETVEDQDALRAKAEEAHARALAGEDFTSLILEYGDDEYMSQHPEDGYYLAEGDSGSDVIDAALFSLAENEISDIVETSSGYFIYKRLPVQESYLDSVFSHPSTYTSYIDTAFSYHIMEIMTAYDNEYLPAFYEVNFSQAAMAFAMSASAPGTDATGSADGTTTDTALPQ